MPAPFRIPRAMILAAVAAFAITAVGQGVWGGLVTLNLATSPTIPWSVAVMAGVLALLFAVLSGRTPPKSNAAARAALTPFAKVTGPQWFWSVLLGAVGIAALARMWITLGALFQFEANPLPAAAGVPPTTMFAFIGMACLAAPLSEEIAFRGYATGILRRVTGPWATLVIVSLLFALAHLTQGAYPSKLLVYFLAGFLFGFIAWRTGSLLPAMAVHSAADLVFFTLVWPGDAARPQLIPGDVELWVQSALIAALATGTVIAGFGLARASNPGGAEGPGLDSPQLEGVSPPG